LKRRIVAVTLAALLAVLGIVAVLAYVGKANQRAMDGIKPASVLVAKQAIPAGTPISQARALLTSHQIPASLVPSDAVRSISQDIADRVINVNIPQGQMLLQEMLVPKSVRTGSLVIPTGELAVSIQLCLAGDVAGYVKPGNQVAVYNTYATGSNQSLEMSCQGTHQAANIGSVTTKLMIPSVTVLSVSPAQVPQASSSGTGSALTGAAASAALQGVVYVTVAATPAEAKLITLLNAAGIPSLGLTTGLGTTPGTTAQPVK
jgi:pilus assembly protein CpaB